MPGVSRLGETPRLARVAPLLESFRPDQWTKNLIVFAGLVFGERLLDLEALGRSTATFAVFCALSSAMYLFNDVVDRERDRLHPRKCRRPIAAGRVSAPAALLVAVSLLGVGAAGAFWLQFPLGLLALAFAGLLGLYSRVLKKLVILDVMVIAIGFVLRAVAGAVVLSAPISQWLLVCTLLGALFLALTKRRQEVAELGVNAGQHRGVLHHYTPHLLDQMVTIAAAATLVSYAVWASGAETVEKFGTNLLTLTIPFPIYGVLRYLLVAQDPSAGLGPSEILLRDRPIAVCVATWGVAVAVIIYRPF